MSDTNISTVFCPRNGAQFYACATGTRFIGCCKLNPCEIGCSIEDISPTFINEIGTMLPDVSCGVASDFYTCSRDKYPNASYWGCCRSNPCYEASGCPVQDIKMAVMANNGDFSAYLTLGFGNMPTSSVGATIPSSTPSVEMKKTAQSQQRDSRLVVGLALAAIILTVGLVLLWLLYRRFASKSDHKDQRNKSTERALFRAEVLESDPADLSSPFHQLRQSPEIPDLIRLSARATMLLLGTSVLALGLLGFLVFLWFGDQSNDTWRNTMVNGWATRAVAITALLLRTAAYVQATIATAILASLVLESRSGIDLYGLARLSLARSGASSPWTFVSWVVEDIYKKRRKAKHNYLWAVIAVSLLTTTSILQFGSTILLSDLDLGSLRGHPYSSLLSAGFSYRCSGNYCPKSSYSKVPRDTSWMTNPPYYPAFGEFAEKPGEAPDGVVDTGVLLRSFLPFADAQSRQLLHNYTGKAIVLDARVVCLAPDITELNGTGHSSELSGRVTVKSKISILGDIDKVGFQCLIGGQSEYTLCQLGTTYQAYLGSVTSQFVNSSTYGAAFLVIKGTDAGGGTTKNTTQILEDDQKKEWTDVIFANKTNTGASISICFAPWDTAAISISATSANNRTEPSLRWDLATSTFDPNEILSQLIPSGDQRLQDLRPVLLMEKPNSYRPDGADLGPTNERPFIQSDASGSSAADYGSNVPLSANWTVFLTGKPLITIRNSFSRTPDQAIAADPALAAIFTGAMASNHSVAWALSSLLTVLSMTNYYSQLPAFDKHVEVTTSFFTTVLFPQGQTGLIILAWIFTAHTVIVGFLVVVFVTRTRLTLLGSDWSAFSQMAESAELMGVVDGARQMPDKVFLEGLKSTGMSSMRARLVRSEKSAEIVLE